MGGQRCSGRIEPVWRSAKGNTNRVKNMRGEDAAEIKAHARCIGRRWWCGSVVGVAGVAVSRDQRRAEAERAASLSPAPTPLKQSGDQPRLGDRHIPTPPPLSLLCLDYCIDLVNTSPKNRQYDHLHPLPDTALGHLRERRPVRPLSHRRRHRRRLLHSA
jgi:hypothetical protein